MSAARGPRSPLKLTQTKKAASEKPLSGAILSSVHSHNLSQGDMASQQQPPAFRGQFTLKTRDKTLKVANPAGRAPPRPAVVLDQNKETYEEKQRRYQEVREKLLGKE